jgi:hypothetical protein
VKRVLGFIGSVLLLYFGLLILLRVFESGLIYFPNFPGRLEGDWRPHGLPVEDVVLHASDGVKLHAWWIAAPSADFTFVAFHGNASNIANRAEIYEFLRGVPANVLAVEYRGYGKSEGKPGEAGLYLDAQAAYDYLVKERGVAPARIVPIGHSLGTAVAADLASQREVAGLVLEAPFPSAGAVAGKIYPLLPGLGLAIKSKFNTVKKLSSVRVPVLVIHCARDPVIPFALGEAVFRAAREPKFFLRIDGSCHEEGALVAPEIYREKLRQFLSSLRGPKRPSS